MSMVALDYKQQLDAIFERVAEIVRERSNLEAEAARLTQLMYATANMLPAKERNEVIEKWVNMFQTQLTRETSLSDAVRKVFEQAGFRERFTVAQVRDRLVTGGYDFTAYLSNPLASVSATLLRLKDKGELDADTVEGVTVYRKKIKRFPREHRNKTSTDVEKSGMRG